MNKIISVKLSYNSSFMEAGGVYENLAGDRVPHGLFLNHATMKMFSCGLATAVSLFPFMSRVLNHELGHLLALEVGKNFYNNSLTGTSYSVTGEVCILDPSSCRELDVPDVFQSEFPYAVGGYVRSSGSFVSDDFDTLVTQSGSRLSLLITLSLLLLVAKKDFCNLDAMLLCHGLEMSFGELGYCASGKGDHSDLNESKGTLAWSAINVALFFGATTYKGMHHLMSGNFQFLSTNQKFFSLSKLSVLWRLAKTVESATRADKSIEYSFEDRMYRAVSLPSKLALFKFLQEIVSSLELTPVVVDLNRYLTKQVKVLDSVVKTRSNQVAPSDSTLFSQQEPIEGAPLTSSASEVVASEEGVLFKFLKSLINPISKEVDKRFCFDSVLVLLNDWEDVRSTVVLDIHSNNAIPQETDTWATVLTNALKYLSHETNYPYAAAIQEALTKHEVDLDTGIRSAWPTPCITDEVVTEFRSQFSLVLPSLAGDDPNAYKQWSKQFLTVCKTDRVSQFFHSKICPDVKSYAERLPAAESTWDAIKWFIPNTLRTPWAILPLFHVALKIVTLWYFVYLIEKAVQESGND